jgi:hypothetical protein
MDGDDGVPAVVLTAEHLLGLAGLDLAIEGVERLLQFGVDRLARLSPLEEHRKVLVAFAEGSDEIPVLLEPTPALEHLLCGGLVFPEVGGGRSRFEPRQLFFGPSVLKDSSADRQPGG